MKSFHSHPNSHCPISPVTAVISGFVIAEMNRIPDPEPASDGHVKGSITVLVVDPEDNVGMISQSGSVVQLG